MAADAEMVADADADTVGVLVTSTEPLIVARPVELVVRVVVISADVEMVADADADTVGVDVSVAVASGPIYVKAAESYVVT